MRVLFVADHGERGGAERSLLELMGALADVEPVLACPGGGALASAALAEGIAVHALPLPPIDRPRNATMAWRTIRVVSGSSRRLTDLIRREGIALVHANTTKAQLVAGLAARWCGLPCVWHWRDFYDMPRLHRALGRTASVAVAISDAIRRDAERQLASVCATRLVRNGLRDRWTAPNPAARAAWRRDGGFADDDVVVLAAGRLIPRKGFDVAIRAAAAAARVAPKLRLVVASADRDERARRELERLAHELRLGSGFSFASEPDDLTTTFEGADLVLVPSRREPFGRVAVEGMLARRPVLASDVDGLAEIVVDGETGHLVDAADPDAFATRLIELAGAPDRRQSFGEAGRERARRVFSIERTAAEIRRIYSELT